MLQLKKILLKIKYYLTQFLLSNFELLWNVIHSFPFISKYTDRILINSITNHVDFPLAYSTNYPYTTIETFTDRIYYNRILPPSDKLSNLPSVKDVVEKLFKRRIDDNLDNYSTFLFVSFAQWFTDQFLMSDSEDSLKQDINNKNIINLCTVYGDTKDQEKILRSLKDGKLKSQLINNEEYPLYVNNESEKILINDHLREILKKVNPSNVNKMFAIGHVRMNITPGTLIFAIIFFREHNRICEILKNNNKSWDDERLYQTAKNILIVIMCKIIIEDYVVGHIAYKLKYPLKFHPEINFDTKWYYGSQRIFIEFNHLYRWHSFVPSKLIMDNHTYEFNEYVWNTNIIINNPLTNIITAFSSNPASKFGTMNTHPLLLPIEENTIETGRKANLASYNDYRERFGLWRLQSFDELTSDKNVIKTLKELYGNIDNVEFYAGLMAEDRGYGNSIFPSLLTTMISAEAFRGILGNPLLAKDIYNENTFTKKGMDIIKDTNFKNLISRNMSKDKSLPFVSFKL
jgi:prostaglandin-endoperoxide synthase 2